MVTTTSVEASGLLERWLPEIEAERKIRIDTVVTGSGKAMRILERRDAHMAITHDPQGEQVLVAGGVADRHPIMWNHFVIVGPPADPARVQTTGDAGEAFRRIASRAAPFVSRGDDSGTHRAEKRLWHAAGVSPAAPWYRETGQGQGVTLQMAHEVHGYMLCDLSTFTSYRRRVDLAVLLRGDPRLRNVYSVLLRKDLTPDRRRAALAVLSWMRAPRARDIMRALRFEPVD